MNGFDSECELIPLWAAASSRENRKFELRRGRAGLVDFLVTKSLFDVSNVECSVRRRAQKTGVDSTRNIEIMIHCAFFEFDSKCLGVEVVTDGLDCCGLHLYPVHLDVSGPFLT